MDLLRPGRLSGKSPTRKSRAQAEPSTGTSNEHLRGQAPVLLGGSRSRFVALVRVSIRMKDPHVSVRNETREDMIWPTAPNPETSLFSITACSHLKWTQAEMQAQVQTHTSLSLS